MLAANGGAARGRPARAAVTGTTVDDCPSVSSAAQWGRHHTEFQS